MFHRQGNGNLDTIHLTVLDLLPYINRVPCRQRKPCLIMLLSLTAVLLYSIKLHLWRFTRSYTQTVRWSDCTNSHAMKCTQPTVLRLHTGHATDHTTGDATAHVELLPGSDSHLGANFAVAHVLSSNNRVCLFVCSFVHSLCSKNAATNQQAKF